MFFDLETLPLNVNVPQFDIRMNLFRIANKYKMCLPSSKNQFEIVNRRNNGLRRTSPTDGFSSIFHLSNISESNIQIFHISTKFIFSIESHYFEGCNHFLVSDTLKGSAPVLLKENHQMIDHFSSTDFKFVYCLGTSNKH